MFKSSRMFLNDPSVKFGSEVSSLSPVDALTAFARMMYAWRMPPGRAWQMLTGHPRPLAALTEDHTVKVAHLLEIDRGLREIVGKPVGEWMRQASRSPFFGGTAPADYLTGRGMPGYVDLHQQVRRWMYM